MNYIKKTFFAIIKSLVYLVVFSTLILFFYAAFFFQKTSVENETAEKQVIKSENTPSASVEKTETAVEETESVMEKAEPEEKIDTSEVENIIDNSIKDSLFATVGNKAITQSDIVSEIKIILILTGQSFTEETKDRLQAGAIQSTIKRTIKKIEIEKYKFLTFNPPDIDKKIADLANDLNIDEDTLKNTFVANEIDFSYVTDQIETELLWNSLIFEIYKDKLAISLDEIDEQLKLIQEKKEIEEYLISEIIIKSVPKDQLKSKIKEIKDKIKIESFEKVATSLSISETALQGGNLGWVSENAISEKFRSKIINTPIGNISEPILLPEGILFFKIRDKRKLKKFESLEEAKNQLVKAEKTKILRMYSLSHFESLRKSISINYY